MGKIIVDTSVIIDFLRNTQKSATLLTKLVEQDNDLYISIITHAELYAGKRVWEGKSAEEELNDLLSGFTILSIDLEISRQSGNIRATQNISLIDAIIAATALVNKLEIATINLKDFEKIPMLKIYKN